VSGRGVRVTGGAFRGRVMAVPAGARPTEGRVREALFSIWGERLAGSRFLDLFAGSGAVGIEAAGRGAWWVVCVDQDASSVRAIAANVSNLAAGQRPDLAGGRRSSPPGETEGFVEARRLVLPDGLARLAADGAEGGRRSVAKLGPPAFDLVFADPPYRFDDFERFLLGLPPLLAAGAEVAIEHSARRQLPLAAGPLVRTDLRRYGESALAFYRAPE
jgi:16S rRNA (guanine966-N2)-methyltransferase